MINLLPPAEKEKLFSEKKEKLTIILGIVISVALICLTLVLLAIKFYILTDTDYQKIILAQAQQQDRTPDFTSLNNTVKKYNTILAQLDSFYKREIYFNQAIQIITNVPSPKGLYLTNFLLSRDVKGVVQVSVSGVSDTRENLLVFQKNIAGTPKIKNPSFSPESWINPKNVNFSLTFSINENEQ